MISDAKVAAAQGFDDVVTVAEDFAVRKHRFSQKGESNSNFGTISISCGIATSQIPSNKQA